MRICRLIRSLFLALLFLAPVTASAASKKLPALGADPARISVSGLSSGAFMAVQYDVAFSASTIGAGVVAGGPYNCAYVNLGGIYTCMQSVPSGQASYQAAMGFAALDQIDAVSNISRQKIYLFSGTNDPVVKQSVMDAVRDFYRAAQVPAANIQYVNGVAAGHAFISDDFGNGCDATQAPFVNECIDGGALYDQPGAVLAQIYGPLKPKAATLSAKPVAFNQKSFASALSGMAPSGYVYIPASCKISGAKCAVHIVFHGCMQSAQEVGDAVYGKLGYNEWADTNGIVVLYPQVDKSMIPFNPKGCWDWWGYSGLNFQTKGGPQPSAVQAMVQRLISN
jgi:poly(3-hydroxybutyrate) depolymerase